MSFFLPKAILDQHLVVLGKTGAGKSSVLRYMVEYLLAHKKRVCIVDPKGDWWGLKSSADGRGPGYPVIAFGDFKEPKASDVPINAHSGAHVAELIATGNRPCIIGFRGWTAAHMVQFWIDFAGGIFNANSGELFLVGDEFHNFAPKGKIMDPQAGRCLHWSNRLLSEGRGLGIVCLLASQRPQKVHNDTLTSCETLVAMRVVHAADRGAIEDWIKGCGDSAQGKEVLNSLAGLARGEAFVWSPEIGFGPKRVTFPMFSTFDSFAPPQLQKRVSEKGWADVDLTAVKEKLAAVIEQAKADDPRELRKKLAEQAKRIVELEKQASKPVPATVAAPAEKRVEVPVLKNGQLQRAEKLAARLEAQAAKVAEQQQRAAEQQRELMAEAERLRKTIEPATSPRPSPVIQKPAPIMHKSAPISRKTLPSIHEKAGSSHPAPQKPASNIPQGIPQNGVLDNVGRGALRRVLAAVAQFPDGITHRKIAILSGIKRSGSTWRGIMAKIRRNEWITEIGETARITQAGFAALGEYDPLPEGAALVSYWIQQLGVTTAGRMFRAIAAAHPAPISMADLEAATGISAGGSTWRGGMAKLRGLELVEGSEEFSLSAELS